MEEDNLPSSSLILPAPKRKINKKIWPYFIIVIYVLIIILSIALLLHMYTIQETKFQKSCPLFGHPDVEKLKNDSFSFNTDENEFQWGSDSYCKFSFFTATFSTLVAFIWCWFFFYSQCDHALGEENFGRDNEQRCLLLPANISALVMSFLCLAQSAIIVRGITQFCDHLSETPAKSCQSASDLSWEYFNDLKGFYTIFQFLLKSSSLQDVITSTITERYNR
ncbi:uncharacterized protein LOC111624975 isoform X2 [Centruroides sculpturatus]|uniref:uncharacterized protein LOC111624975 isoform X2 n=1 Tax=Centruroides sculpturatus TaxID=218467 RepID=UPI000C6CCD16|nr:uncharacterized protein LOC111624975 isoform X2 [Centruroides sculpturatus]